MNVNPEQGDVDQRAVEQQMREITLKDQSKLRVLDSGQGEPILFLPMIKDMNFVYARQLEEFGVDHRVMRWESKAPTSSPGVTPAPGLITWLRPGRRDAGLLFSWDWLTGTHFLSRYSFSPECSPTCH